MMIWRLAPYLAAMALAAATGWQGYRLGGQAEVTAQAQARAELQADLFDAAERASRLAVEIEAARAAMDAEGVRYEDAARADDPDSRRPGADSLRRLRAQFGAAGAP